MASFDADHTGSDLADRLAEQAGRLRSYFVGKGVRQPADIDELVSETHVRALGGLPGLKDPEALSPWLHTIARRVFADYLRKLRSEQAFSESGDGNVDVPVNAEFEDVDQPIPTLPNRLIAIVPELQKMPTTEDVGFQKEGTLAFQNLSPPDLSVA